MDCDAALIRLASPSSIPARAAALTPRPEWAIAAAIPPAFGSGIGALRVGRLAISRLTIPPFGRRHVEPPAEGPIEVRQVAEPHSVCD